MKNGKRRYQEVWQRLAIRIFQCLGGLGGGPGGLGGLGGGPGGLGGRSG